MLLPGAAYPLRARLGSRPAGTDQASRPQKAVRKSSCSSAQANTWRLGAAQKVRLAMFSAWDPPYTVPRLEKQTKEADECSYRPIDVSRTPTQSAPHRSAI